MKALQGFEVTVCGTHYIVNVGDEIPPRVAAHWAALNLTAKLRASGVIPKETGKTDGASTKK